MSVYLPLSPRKRPDACVGDRASGKSAQLLRSRVRQLAATRLQVVVDQLLLARRIGEAPVALQRAFHDRCVDSEFDGLVDAQGDRLVGAESGFDLEQFVEAHELEDRA